MLTAAPCRGRFSSGFVFAFPRVPAAVGFVGLSPVPAHMYTCVRAAQRIVQQQQCSGLTAARGANLTRRHGEGRGHGRPKLRRLDRTRTVRVDAQSCVLARQCQAPPGQTEADHVDGALVPALNDVEHCARRDSRYLPARKVRPVAKAKGAAGMIGARTAGGHRKNQKLWLRQNWPQRRQQARESAHKHKHRGVAECYHHTSTVPSSEELAIMSTFNGSKSTAVTSSE